MSLQWKAVGLTSFPTVETYQDEDGDVELGSLQQAIEDWRGTLTDLDTLQQVIETWRVI